MAKSKKDETQTNEPSAKLQDKARELGIEPSGYQTEEALQERVDQVAAEKKAVAGKQNAKGSNDNLNTADDEDAASTEKK